MIGDFFELQQQAAKCRNIVVGVASPEDEHSVKTVIECKNRRIADFVLAGKKEKISELIIKFNGNPADFDIIEAESEIESAQKIVDLVHVNGVQVVLKGFLATASLMKPVLDRDRGLRTGRLLSDISIIENPLSEKREFLGVTDGGLNILPDLIQKREILQNGVDVFHRLGYPVPRVGIMAAYEKISQGMQATVDAGKLTELNRSGEISNCDIFGPLALDVAVSVEAARHKGIENNVAGRVQIMVVPNIESGNMLVKSFNYFLKAPVAHVVMGARVPILIPSRNEPEKDKVNSVALGVVCAKNLK